LTLDGLLARVDDPGGPLEAARGELAAYNDIRTDASADHRPAP